MSDETERRAQYLVAEIGPHAAVDKITKAISHIDVSRIARKHGDLGSAENALSCARSLLIEVLGIKDNNDDG